MTSTTDRGPSAPKGARIGADIGGTFTDIVLEVGDRRHSTKLLTTYDAPERALLDGVRLLLDEAGVAPAEVSLVVHGTTLATNALIERRGVPTALLTTDGFRDVLALGSESRFDQYDIGMEKPQPLVPRRLRVGVAERMDARGQVLVPLDGDAVRAAAAEWREQGIRSVAIAFLHSYANDSHERRAAEILAAEMPGVSLSLSSEVSPEMREYERFSTTVANAYVQPLVDAYLHRLDEKLKAMGFGCPLYLMLSSGGLTTVDAAARYPVRLVESGPAGGAIFAASVAAERGVGQVVALDVGGTTAKICLINDGMPQTSQVFEVGRAHRFRKGSGLPLRIPVVEMVEIGAGGGSIASVDNAGRLAVGPHSAGSEPGPAAYGRGGTRPTVTDADITLGRIDPSRFAGGKVTLNAGASHDALAALGIWDGKAETLAIGVSEIVDETMASAARVHAVEQGMTLDDRSLIAFGGAAPLHAARFAEKLGIREVIIPSGAGVGSAIGFLRAPVSYEMARSLTLRLDQLDLDRLNSLLDGMTAEARALVEAGAPGAAQVERRTCLARYKGQGYEIPFEIPARTLVPEDVDLLRAAFETAYRTQYGGVTLDLPIEALTWRVTVGSPAWKPKDTAVVTATRDLEVTERRPVIDPDSGAALPFALVRREVLRPGDRVRGPALITERETTTVVSPRFDAWMDANGYLILTRREEG
ncbi:MULTISPECIES: hydantoinase/oxoprolinase family protein [Nitrospirillum]|uniref:N-methylhydantoinase A n=1 Tax=Nitrospirillum amazonense TaxID=28077 RepID=A0A560F1S3_9PROT|nr:hydantoinase/oxoprolinase family protein [Nitrospirillum amazonense]MEC4594734.1 hydantoinase/oxoprolinase family protein [Nitrospirillum amazonense]TWB15568.1 N-methylhydantoinase A [Nitrospirillum amazonense]